MSSAEKGKLVEDLGATGWIDRNEFKGMMRTGNEDAGGGEGALRASRGASSKAVKETSATPPNIVFEHVGQATFPTSVFTVKPFGKVVICAGNHRASTSTSTSATCG